MTPEAHPENERNIQREQQRLDELDAKRDRTIDTGEEPEQLTQTYIQRVNDVQGYIRDLHKKIEVQKDMKAPHWQKLESTCFDVQGRLLERLSAIDEENISRDVAAFNGAIDEFLSTLKSVDSHREEEGGTPETPSLTSLEASMSIVRSKRESKIDERLHVQDALRDIQDAIHRDTKALATHAKRSDKEYQPMIVERLKSHQSELTQVEQQLALTSQSVTMFDIQITALQAQKEREHGNTREADRLLIKLKERFGNALAAMHPGIWNKVGEAEQRLLLAGELSDFEQSLLRRKDNTLHIAVEQQRRAAIGEVDFLDQYRGYGLSLRHESPRVEIYRNSSLSHVPIGHPLAFSHLVPSSRNSLLQLKLPPKLQLGKMRNGEVIVIQADVHGEHEVQRPLLLAFRDNKGVVRLQDGKEVRQPVEIRPSSVGRMKNIYLSPAAQQMFERTPHGYRIALRSTPRRVAVQSWNAPSVRLLTTDDLVYVGTHEENLFVKDAKKQLLTVTNINDLEKQREEQSRDVLRALDSNSTMQAIIGKTSVIQMHMQGIGELLSSGAAEGAEKAEEYVEYARSQARPLLALLNDPQLKGQLQAVKQQLQTLEKTQFGFALGGIEREIADRIDAIDDMVDVLENQDIRRMCETILDKSKFSPDTWSQWLKTEGVKFLAAIVVATTVIVTIVATCGAATPLWAIAAAGAAGGIVGSELAAEGVHLSYHVFDEEVQSGNATYSDRSLLGKYFEGQKVIDPVTGQERDMSFLFDVANPYAQQFFVNFAITYATLGAGRWAAGKISILAQNSKWIQTMTQNGGFQRMTQSLGRINARYEAIADKSLARKIVMESLQEIGEENAEAGVQQGLNRIDARLGMLAGFLVVTGQGIRLRPRVRGFAVDVPATASVEQSQEALRVQLEAEGYSADMEGSIMMVTMWNGEKVEVEFSQTESADDVAATLSVFGTAEMQALRNLGFKNVDAARKAIQISKIPKEQYIASGKVPEDGTNVFIRNRLEKAGTGEPGISIGPARLGNHTDVTRIVYRGPEGQPIACADVVHTFDLIHERSVAKVINFAADNTKGVLGARAAIEVGKQLVEMGALAEGGDISPDAKKLLHNFMSKQVAKMSPEMREALERGVLSKGELLLLAKRHDINMLKDYLKINDVDKPTRIQLFKELCGVDYQEGMGELVYELHEKHSSTIDGGTQEDVAANAVKLRRLQQRLREDFDLTEEKAQELTMLALDSGLAGKPSPPPTSPTISIWFRKRVNRSSGW